jgi:hypothetical protein
MTATQRTRETAQRSSVSAIAVPVDARALTTLSRIDYQDAFRLDAGVERPAEEWVRATLNDPPLIVRARLVAGWLALGLNLQGPWSAHRVLGWRVQHRDPNVVLLAADSWLGLRGQLLFRSEPGGLLFATFIQHDNPLVRSLWNAITPHHQHVVHSLLLHAARRAAAGEAIHDGAMAHQLGPDWRLARG